MSALVLLTAGLMFGLYNGVRYFRDPDNRSYSAAQWRQVAAHVPVVRPVELPEDSALRKLVEIDRRIGGRRQGHGS